MCYPRSENISLLWSEKAPRGTSFYKHFVPPGRRREQPTILICYLNSRDRTLETDVIHPRLFSSALVSCVAGLTQVV
jgi:hypothetical protein